MEVRNVIIVQIQWIMIVEKIKNKSYTKPEIKTTYNKMAYKYLKYFINSYNFVYGSLVPGYSYIKLASQFN